MSEIDPEIAAWCRTELGRAAVDLLFEHNHLSRVIGLRLENGLEVVLKMRQPQERIYDCTAVHKHLWRLGFPCAEPLAGPFPIGDRMVTAERYVPGGETLTGTVDNAMQFAAALTDLVETASSHRLQGDLSPAPAWMGWEHAGAPDVLWPPADDLDVDLNDYPEPEWLNEIAARTGSFLRATDLPRVIGHVDWHAGNLRWQGTRLMVAHDWDSLALLPDAAIAGGASVLYTASLRAEASIEASEAFLTAYERARREPWSDEERRVAWAAGLWNLAFDAKKASIDGVGESLERMQQDANARLRLAGLD